MLRALHTFNDRKKNNQLVNIIKSGLSDLKNEIERMSEDEIKIEKPYEILLKRSLSLIGKTKKDKD